MITPKMQLAFFDNHLALATDLAQGMRLLANFVPSASMTVGRMADDAINRLNAMHDVIQEMRVELQAEVAAEEKGENPDPLAARVAALETTVSGMHGALASAPSPVGVQKAVADVEPLPESPAEPAEH